MNITITESAVEHLIKLVDWHKGKVNAFRQVLEMLEAA